MILRLSLPTGDPFSTLRDVEADPSIEQIFHQFKHQIQNEPSDVASKRLQEIYHPKKDEFNRA